MKKLIIILGLIFGYSSFTIAQELKDSDPKTKLVTTTELGVSSVQTGTTHISFGLAVEVEKWTYLFDIDRHNEVWGGKSSDFVGIGIGKTINSKNEAFHLETTIEAEMAKIHNSRKGKSSAFGGSLSVKPGWAIGKSVKLGYSLEIHANSILSGHSHGIALSIGSIR